MFLEKKSDNKAACFLVRLVDLKMRFCAFLAQENLILIKKLVLKAKM